MSRDTDPNITITGYKGQDAGTVGAFSFITNTLTNMALYCSIGGLFSKFGWLGSERGSFFEGVKESWKSRFNWGLAAAVATWSAMRDYGQAKSAQEQHFKISVENELLRQQVAELGEAPVGIIQISPTANHAPQHAQNHINHAEKIAAEKETAATPHIG